MIQKLFFISLLLAMYSPLQGMSTLARITGRATATFLTKTTHPGLYTKPGARTLTQLADTHSLYLLGQHSPLLGLVATSPIPTLHGLDRSQLSKALSQGKNPSLNNLCKLFFHENPVTQELAITQYNQQILQALPPRAAAYLLQKTSNLSNHPTKEQLTKEWYDRYTTLTKNADNRIIDPKNFRKKAKKFFQEFDDHAQQLDISEVNSVVLSALIKMNYDRKDLQEFAQCFSVDLQPKSYTHEDFLFLDTFLQNNVIPIHEYCPKIFEEMLYWCTRKRELTYQGYDSALLKTPRSQMGYKGLEPKRLCTEESLRTVINVLCYNTKTRMLDLSLLPEKARGNSAFCAFVEKYKNIHCPDYYTTTSTAEWLALLSELPGITYVSKLFEIKSHPHNALAALKFIFGMPEITSYKELAQALSTPTRTVSFLETACDPGEKIPRTIKMILEEKTPRTDDQEQVSIKIKAHFPEHHSHVSFASDDIFSSEGLTNLSNMYFLLTEGHTLPGHGNYQLVDLKTVSLEDFALLTRQTAILNSERFLYKVLTSKRPELFESMCKAGFKASDDLIKTLMKEKKYSLFATALAHREEELINPELLSYAITSQNLKCIEILVAQGISVTGENKNFLGETPLNFALHARCALPCIKLLVQLGANPALKDAQGKTAHAFAQEYDSPKDIQNYLSTLKPTQSNS